MVCNGVVPTFETLSVIAQLLHACARHRHRSADLSRHVGSVGCDHGKEEKEETLED